MQRFDPKQNFRRYLIGILLTVVAVAASYFFTLQAIGAGADWAGIINMSGRQRMLSQRIQFLAQQAQQADINTTDRAILRQRFSAAIDLFEASHRELSLSGDRGYADRLTPALRALYFDPRAYDGTSYASDNGESLDARVKALIGDARRVLSGAAESVAAAPMLDELDRLKLLRQLDHVVHAYEREADQSTALLEWVALLCLLAILLIIFVEVVFVFRPAHLWTVRAINRLTELAQSATVAQARAEEALKAKSVFLSNMSHEIRTPLNGIIGSLQVFSDDKMSRSSKKLIDAITQSSKSLLAIVNDILDVSKLEAGALALHKAPGRVTDLITSSALLMRPAAERKGLQLELKNDLPDGLVASIDQTRLTQVLNNLLSNAVKFTDEGTVSLEARLVAPQSATPRLLVSVRDTGAGIPAEQLNRIFERFSQVSRAEVGGVKGTGLGLSISREIAALMGGTLDVDSCPGEGSCFTLDVPLEIVDAVNSEATVAAPTRLKILLVEDIALNRELARRMLSQMGHRVDLAVDGLDALEKINAAGDRPWDLLIVDNRMPRKSGLELIADVRAMNSSLADVPIIVMSADVLDEEREAFLNAGATGFVPKPVDMDTLAAQIALCVLARE